MKIKSIAPWFGGKRTMAKTIVAELGEHAQYFEPFCGSLAVLLAKPLSRQETANDLHSDLVNLAVCLQDEHDSKWLYERTNRSIVSDGLLKAARDYFAEVPEVADIGSRERAYWYFVTSWMSRNGIAGLARQDFQLAVRWTAGGGSPSTRWNSAVESLPVWHERLKNVVVLNRDAFEIIPKIEDAPHTAIYVDSPYMPETRSQGEYVHEFGVGSHSLFESKLDDHERLRDLLVTFKFARIVVSYYDCPRVRQLYDGWTILDEARNKNLHAQNGRGPRQQSAPEILIINGPSLRSAP